MHAEASSDLSNHTVSQSRHLCSHQNAGESRGWLIAELMGVGWGGGQAGSFHFPPWKVRTRDDGENRDRRDIGGMGVRMIPLFPPRDKMRTINDK